MFFVVHISLPAFVVFNVAMFSACNAQRKSSIAQLVEPKFLPERSCSFDRADFVIAFVTSMINHQIMSECEKWANWNFVAKRILATVCEFGFELEET